MLQCIKIFKTELELLFYFVVGVHSLGQVEEDSLIILGILGRHFRQLLIRFWCPGKAELCRATSCLSPGLLCPYGEFVGHSSELVSYHDGPRLVY